MKSGETAAMTAENRRRSGQLGDTRGEIEVLGGQTAGVVGDEGQADAVVTDVDVGVVAGLLGELADVVNEAKGGHEVGELEGPDEFTGFDAPIGEAVEARFNFVGCKWGHD